MLVAPIVLAGSTAVSLEVSGTRSVPASIAVSITCWVPNTVLVPAAMYLDPQTVTVEAGTTNVLGTQRVIETAIDAGTERVQLTSSDTAVDSANTTGATNMKGSPRPI